MMNSKGLYDSQPPAFGHALKAYYAMDPEYINLNNGRNFSCPLALRLKKEIFRILWYHSKTRPTGCPGLG